MPDADEVIVAPLGLAELDALEGLSARALPGAWSRAQLAEELEHPLAVALGARREGALLGFALARLALDEAELLLIGVEPELRRRGLGRSLLIAALDALVARGARRCLLEVRATNAPAIALYRAEGFTEIGRRARYYADGEDAVVLGRPLSP